MKFTSLACLRKKTDSEAKTFGAAVMLPGGAPSAQAIVDPSSRVIDQLRISCTSSGDFDETMACLSECLTRTSSLHPLSLDLKDSSRGVRKTKNRKLVLHCGTALTASAQETSCTREI